MARQILSDSSYIYIVLYPRVLKYEKCESTKYKGEKREKIRLGFSGKHSRAVLPISRV